MIEIHNLVKRYGDQAAVDHLDLTIEQGQVCGLLGLNGAGKTTTMNMITGYLAPTEGQIIINGHDILEEPEEAKRCIGYLPDQPPLDVYKRQGLHQRDNDLLLGTLRKLRDLGNTLLVVEHDEDTMRATDFIEDVGPGAGIHGGEIVATGTAEEIMACPRSITGAYLSGRLKIPVPTTRRSGNGHFLTVRGAAENNLKGIDVSIPLGTLTCLLYTSRCV